MILNYKYMEEFIEKFNEFREWLYSDEVDGRLHAIRDKFEELGLDRVF